VFFFQNWRAALAVACVGKIALKDGEVNDLTVLDFLTSLI
jgi:hypothetical protein